jgi:hypothetical protein
MSCPQDCGSCASARAAPDDTDDVLFLSSTPVNKRKKSSADSSRRPKRLFGRPQNSLNESIPSPDPCAAIASITPAGSGIDTSALRAHSDSATAKALKSLDEFSFTSKNTQRQVSPPLSPRQLPGMVSASSTEPASQQPLPPNVPRGNPQASKTDRSIWNGSVLPWNFLGNLPLSPQVAQTCSIFQRPGQFPRLQGPRSDKPRLPHYTGKRLVSGVQTNHSQQPLTPGGGICSGNNSTPYDTLASKQERNRSNQVNNVATRVEFSGFGEAVLPNYNIYTRPGKTGVPSEEGQITLPGATNSIVKTSMPSLDSKHRNIGRPGLFNQPPISGSPPGSDASSPKVLGRHHCAACARRRRQHVSGHTGGRKDMRISSDVATIRKNYDGCTPGKNVDKRIDMHTVLSQSPRLIGDHISPLINRVENQMAYNGTEVIQVNQICRGSGNTSCKLPSANPHAGTTGQPPMPLTKQISGESLRNSPNTLPANPVTVPETLPRRENVTNKHIIVDIAETCEAVFPFNAVAARHNIPSQKVKDIFEAIIQVPLLRCPTDKRRAGKLGTARVKDYNQAKKVLKTTNEEAPKRTDGDSPSPLEIAAMMSPVAPPFGSLG